MAELLYRLGRVRGPPRADRRRRVVRGPRARRRRRSPPAADARHQLLHPRHARPPRSPTSSRRPCPRPRAGPARSCSHQDGWPFTAEQEARDLRRWSPTSSDVDGVETVVDPFATEAERADAGAADRGRSGSSPTADAARGRPGPARRRPRAARRRPGAARRRPGPARRRPRAGRGRGRGRAAAAAARRPAGAARRRQAQLDAAAGQLDGAAGRARGQTPTSSRAGRRSSSRAPAARPRRGHPPRLRGRLRRRRERRPSTDADSSLAGDEGRRHRPLHRRADRRGRGRLLVRHRPGGAAVLGPGRDRRPRSSPRSCSLVMLGTLIARRAAARHRARRCRRRRRSARCASPASSRCPR